MPVRTRLHEREKRVGPVEPDALVTVFASTQSWESRLAQAALEAAGIEAFIADENLAHANWLYAGAVGGVKVQVRAAEKERAEAALTEAGVTRTARRRCPKCGSEDTRSSRLPAYVILGSWLLLGIPFLFHTPRYHCRQCGHEWKAGEGVKNGTAGE
ncbi:hypothetical protein DQK91_10795 [Oceanidesulfovibrio marinus]|uniref:DUF2007 domain-containing protein n=1 Tax=Oceanidesulfovibrio marinus TaxID=370038 RepID=A0A6P1ZGD8_9BACT|nr:hypothetical protein DQK91_10795 [Oceanidesulfovibrio marinus]